MAKSSQAKNLKKRLPALLLALGAVAAVPCALADDTSKPATPTTSAGSDGKAASDAGKADGKSGDSKTADSGAKKKKAANPCAGQ